MSMTKKLAIAGILSGACLAVHAAPVTYLAADNNVTTLAQMVNSTAAAASFLSVAGALNTVDFESPLPANLTITAGHSCSQKLRPRSRSVCSAVLNMHWLDITLPWRMSAPLRLVASVTW